LTSGLKTSASVKPTLAAVDPSKTDTPRRWHRLSLAAVLLAFFVLLVWFVALRQAVLFAVGIGMGAALAGARFGFTTGWRQLVEDRDPRGAVGQLLLLGLAATLSMPLLASYPELQAALGPPSVSLVLGAFVFGLAMQISDGCGSGTLYKAGLGVPLNMGILPLFALGSFLGSAHLDRWLALGEVAPVSIVQSWGAGPALAGTWIALIAIGIGMRLWAGWGRGWIARRWVWGAIALAILAMLNLAIAGQPWGVVYGFGLWAAKLAQATGSFDATGNVFWSQAGNAQRLSQSLLLDVTSITNIGILGGALWIAARHGGASTRPLTGRQWLIGLVAGFVLGYSSRLAFGCNIGAMLSGISTGSLHGWIWMPMAFAGTLIGVRVRRHFGF